MTSTDQPWDAEADEIAHDASTRRAAGDGVDRRRLALVGAGVVAAVAVVALLGWFGASATEGTISTQVVTYTVEDRELTVTYDVTREVGTDVVCTVEAVDAEHASVGTLEDDVPASEESSVRTTTTVRTTTRAANVTEPECRTAP